jgi:hypothetical protein
MTEEKAIQNPGNHEAHAPAHVVRFVSHRYLNQNQHNCVYLEEKDA